MAFKIKNPYPTNRKGKINPNSEGNTDLKDGRSASAAFQYSSPAKQAVGKHPLYEQLSAEEKKIYDALTPEEKVNVDKNETLSQLKNALGPEPEWEGGDDDMG